MVEQRRAGRGGYDEGSTSPFSSGTLRLSDVSRSGDYNTGDSLVRSPREHKAQKSFRCLNWKVLLLIVGLLLLVTQASGNIFTIAFWSRDATPTTQRTGKRAHSGPHETDDWEAPFSLDDAEDETQLERSEDHRSAKENGNRPVEARGEVHSASGTAAAQTPQGNRETRLQQVSSDHDAESFKSSSGAVRKEDEHDSDTWPAEPDWSPDGEEKQEQADRHPESKVEHPKASMEDWSPDSQKESAHDEALEDEERASSEHRGQNPRDDSDEEPGAVHKGEGLHDRDTRSGSWVKAEVDTGDDTQTSEDQSGRPSRESMGTVHTQHRVPEAVVDGGREALDAITDSNSEDAPLEELSADEMQRRHGDQESQPSVVKDVGRDEMYAGSEDLPAATQTPSPKVTVPLNGQSNEGEQTDSSSSDTSNEVPQRQRSDMEAEVGSIHRERVDTRSAKSEESRGIVSEKADEQPDGSTSDTSNEVPQRQHSDMETEAGSIRSERVDTRNAKSEETRGTSSESTAESVGVVASGEASQQQHADINVGSIRTEGSKNHESKPDDAQDVDGAVRAEGSNRNSDNVEKRSNVVASLNQATEQYAGAEELPTLLERTSGKPSTLLDPPPAAISIKSNKVSNEAEDRVGDVRGESSVQKEKERKSVTEDGMAKKDVTEGAPTQLARNEDLGAVKVEKSVVSKQSDGNGDLGAVKVESSSSSSQNEVKAESSEATKGKLASTSPIPTSPVAAQTESLAKSPAEANAEVGAVRSESKPSDPVVGAVHKEGSKIATRDEMQATGSTPAVSKSSSAVATKDGAEVVGAVKSEASVSTTAGAVGAVSLDKPMDDSKSKQPPVEASISATKSETSPSSASGKTGGVTIEKSTSGERGVGSIKSEVVASPEAASVGSVSSEMAPLSTTKVSASQTGRITSTTTSSILGTTTFAVRADNEVGSVKSETISSEVGVIGSESRITLEPQAARFPSTTTSTTSLSYTNAVATTFTATLSAASGIQIGAEAVGAIHAEVGAIHSESTSMETARGNLRGSAAVPEAKTATEAVAKNI